MPDHHLSPANQPVRVVATGSKHDDPATPVPGIALCLSGGGYRAMLFHTGALWRLNELGYFRQLKRISSVSGGSIVSAFLGFKWRRLTFDGAGVATNYGREVVDPIRALASRTIDRRSVVLGVLMPGSVGDKVSAAYREHLFGRATLQDLPPDPPRFVINATNVQTGALFRFSRPFVADYRLGRILNPTIELAVAVAASSAFPPVLSPVEIKFPAAVWTSEGRGGDLHRPPFLTHVVLSDGGVYDNMGLETAWKRYDTILVSNGGGKMTPDEEPKSDWARHALRVNELIDNQVRSLRVRQVIDAFRSGVRQGTYWGIRTNITEYQIGDSLPCPVAQTKVLAETATRLKAMPAVLQERLINWGYAVCDAAMRTHVDKGAARPGGFPYGRAGVG